LNILWPPTSIFGEETHPEIILKPHAAYSAVGGLMIHTFFDGVSIAAAFLVDRKLVAGFYCNPSS